MGIHGPTASSIVTFGAGHEFLAGVVVLVVASFVCKHGARHSRHSASAHWEDPLGTRPLDRGRKFRRGTQSRTPTLCVGDEALIGGPSHLVWRPISTDAVRGRNNKGPIQPADQYWMQVVPRFPPADLLAESNVEGEVRDKRFDVLGDFKAFIDCVILDEQYALASSRLCLLFHSSTR